MPSISHLHKVDLLADSQDITELKHDIDLSELQAYAICKDTLLHMHFVTLKQPLPDESWDLPQ